MNRFFLTVLLSTLLIANNAFAQSIGDFDITSVLFPSSRKPIARSDIGLNAFFNQPENGSIKQQSRDIARTLKLNKLRVLFAWNDAVQSSSIKAPFFGFYDDIMSSLPRSSKALVVVTGLPEWVKSQSQGDALKARQLFLEQWVRPVVRRYKDDPRFEAIQIWNEHNDVNNNDNQILGFIDNPQGYVDFIRDAKTIMTQERSSALLVNSATTAINQNFPKSFRYNSSMVDKGLLSIVDVYAIHYYGSQFENFLRPEGLRSFASSIKTPVWVTESGAKGFSKQVRYVQRTWPLIRSAFPTIKRFYYYSYSESSALNRTYGLRVKRQTSPLYRYLRRLR